MLTFDDNKVVRTIQIPLEITESDIESVIVTGFEGGCNYWLGLDNKDKKEWESKPKDEPISTWSTKLLLDGHSLSLFDIEDEEENWTLTLDKLIEGIKLNSINRPFDSDLKNLDATTADCIIQYALFEEIVYG